MIFDLLIPSNSVFKLEKEYKTLVIQFYRRQNEISDIFI